MKGIATHLTVVFLASMFREESFEIVFSNLSKFSDSTDALLLTLYGI